MDATERRARATDEATRWWTRLWLQSADEVSENDRQQFTQWLRESPLHVAEILQIAQVHDTLARFKHWQDICDDTGSEVHTADANVIPLSLDDRALPGEKKTADSRPLRVWAFAASIGLAIISAGWLMLAFRGQTIETTRAERREVMLGDGSIVKLEPESAIRVRLNDAERRIVLTHGRALFHVAREPRRPFLVEADRTTVRALGTAFGVERRNRGIVVTVAEGKVAVSSASDPAETRAGSAQLIFAPSERANRSAVADSSKKAQTLKRPLVLTAGKQVTVQRSGSTEPVHDVDASRALAWAEGRLVFDSATLNEVAEEFNRYNHVQLRISDPTLARRSVSGVFQASDPETLVAFIGAGAHVIVTRQGAQEILISPAPRPAIDSRPPQP